MCRNRMVEEEERSFILFYFFPLMHGHVSKGCWSASAVISHWKFNLSTALSFCCTLFCLQPILRNVASACGSTVSDFFLRSLQFVFGPTPQTCFWIYRKGLICFRNFIAASYSKIVLWLAQITDQFIRCRLLLIEIQKRDFVLTVEWRCKFCRATNSFFHALKKPLSPPPLRMRRRVTFGDFLTAVCA